ncbi:MAG: class I tRNA ligase family protein [Candidatus Woesearchaeota archaeon]
MVHGSNSTEEGSKKSPENERHWKRWLKNELEKEGIKVSNELYPNDWYPKYNDWKELFEKNNIDENSILIGHSAGGAFLVRWLDETGRKIKKLILVSPGKAGKQSRNFLDDLYGNVTIKNIGKNVKSEIVIYTSNNDIEKHIIGAKEYSEELPAKVITLENKGHFTEKEMGTKEFPELLNEVLYEDWKVFTTRPDTLMGVTFLVISAQHTRLMELVTKDQKKKVEDFVKKLTSVSEEEIDQLEKEGVFTGSYATHPITNEKIPVYAGNFVLADYGCGMVMAVPTHDQRDFEFAKKYNIPMKQVIAPYFITDKGPDAFQVGKPVVKRHSIHVIIKHWSEDKYLCLDWTKFGWHTLVVGGINEGESPEEATVREIEEETGYQDIKSIKNLNLDIIGEFYASHKNENRSAHFVSMFVELGSDKQVETKPEHNKHHKMVWLDKKDVMNFLNIPTYNKNWETYLNEECAYTDAGRLINSGNFNDLPNDKAKEEITKELTKLNKGNKTVNFKLRDWLISRQRYWGTPIPIIYCENCGEVLDENIPVTLPMDVKFGEGNPLTTSESFVNCKCPKCGNDAKRETDTMDTFVNSSWYNLRYADAKNNKEIFNKEKVNYWNPIDLYIGGKEHACMHLIYIRFYTKFLRDLGLLNFDEPAIKMFNQGMIQGADGNKMSKSKGNTVDVTEIIDKYGADALRMYLVSVAGPESDFNWNDRGLESIAKFLNKVEDYFENVRINSSTQKTNNKVHSTLKEVTILIEKMRFNLAIIKIRELFDYLSNEESKENLEIFVKMLSPFCPHLAEELSEKIGNKEFVSISNWPKFDESKINSEFDFEDKFILEVKEDISNVQKLLKIEKINSLKLIVANKWKYDLYLKLKSILNEISNPNEIIPKIMNSELKQYGQEIMKIVPKIVKTKVVPDFVSQEKEEEILKNLVKEFDFKVEVSLAEDSQEAKAKNAMPGKPSIIVN